MTPNSMKSVYVRFNMQCCQLIYTQPMVFDFTLKTPCEGISSHYYQQFINKKEIQLRS